MALKGQRSILETDPTHTCLSAAVPGDILCHATDGSGIALGDSAGAVDLYASPSGKVVAGLLLDTVNQVDTTRYQTNVHLNEVDVGDHVVLLKKGTVTTNRITGTPAVGGIAYLTANGVLTPTLSTTGGLVATPKVGKFQSIKDADGYVRVDINLPIV